MNARDVVGYGSQRPRVVWPNGAHVAINFVVNYEEGSEYSFEMGDGRNETVLSEVSYPYPAESRDLAVESIYEYGSRAGIWRLLDVFDEFNFNFTMFGCAVALERNPSVAIAARSAGHDLLSHGWRWTEHWTLDREEEKRHMQLAMESFERTWGSKPEGWYCRYGPSENTRSLVVEHGGFLYDSDAYNDDLPYFVEQSDSRHLVIPYSLTYNDMQGDASPGLFLDYLMRALKELALEGSRGYPKMMSVGLHPRLAGQAARTSVLREFMSHLAGRDDVWVARRVDIAKWWIEHADDFVVSD